MTKEEAIRIITQTTGNQYIDIRRDGTATLDADFNIDQIRAVLFMMEAPMGEFHLNGRHTMVNGLTENETNATPSCEELLFQWRVAQGYQATHDSDLVRVKFRDGTHDEDKAGAYDWGHGDVERDSDIVAYRLVW